MSKTANKTINIAKDFSPYPAGRVRGDGPNSGERFRDDFLIPALRAGHVDVVVDGVAGLPSSFYEEAFGGLVRAGFRLDELKQHLAIVANSERMSIYPNLGWKYMAEEFDRVSGSKAN